MKFRTYILVIAVFSLNTITSCKKFITADPPKNSLIPSTVFKNDELATSAVLGIYRQMRISNYASGDLNSIPVATGVASDEMIGYNTALIALAESQMTPENAPTNTMWNSIYVRIYDANAILEGLEDSEGMTQPVRSRLKGEALFVRAFNYFYLVNLFSNVPLHLHTDVKTNSLAKRSVVSEVYRTILSDLLLAETLLPETATQGNRVRPSKDSARALLARAYLYNREWANAEKYAALLIQNTAAYSLVNLNDVFLSSSREAIWQLMPDVGSNTYAGGLHILITTPSVVSLRKELAENAFDILDKRKAAWIRTLTVNNTVYYYPFKYKVRTATTTTEFYMVFRLAEQYLIRAEARTQLGNLSAAIDDLDKLRERAGLPLLKVSNSGISQENMLKAIQNERRLELFSEWGHRWFDLRRTNQLTEVLPLIKPNWQGFYQNFPIPFIETSRNVNMEQNQGY